ncbi:peptidoglycan DD-metalloendopeptidase family protein [Alteromonas sp.]|nr:peptidoglycan DD-metalloendopeptidase family protein [Alteromonas sp.]
MKLSPSFLLLLFVISLTIQGCGSRTAPAPVVLLNSQIEDEEGIFSSDTYEVQPGDTLYAIAWYTGNDYQDIAKYNNLSTPYRIFPGQKLRMTAPEIVARSSSPSPDRTSQSTAPTISTKTKGGIDQPRTQGYGESEKNVNGQNVTVVKKPSTGVKKVAPKTFPSKIKRWVWPAKGKIVGSFNKAESGNKGIDIAAAKGSPVYAAADGKVVYSGSALRGYGNLVIVKHTDTFLSAYAYNDTIDVKEREWVSAGQQIATMGNSGTDSVKLHFEVRYRGKSLDPMRYLPSSK